MSTKPDTETGWSKEFPVVRNVRERYWIRNGQQLTILQVNPSGRHEAIGSNTRYLASDFHGWEFLGPISPSDFEQLIRLRKAAEAAIIALDMATFSELDATGERAKRLLREALAHTGEQS